MNGGNGHDGQTARHELKRLSASGRSASSSLSRPVGSQREVVDALSAQGFEVTQATVSRDITELGLVKAPRRRRPRLRHARARRPAERPRPTAPTSGSRRILADIPVTIGRSGLILVLTGTPGTASVIAQAIDESTLREQEGTLAGDNTLLVLFADEARLERWLERFRPSRRSGATPPRRADPEVPVP